MAIDKIQSESINLADNFAFTGTVTGAGGNNTPFFYGELASTTTISRDSYVKVTGMTGDEIDTDSAFDGTTFTVPSGQGGKYYLFGSIMADYELAGDDGKMARVYFYKNGSSLKEARWQQASTYYNMRMVSETVSGIFTLSAGDTIELYTLLNDNNGTDARLQSNNTSIGGYKIIE
jgi:hypothetical protein